MRGIKWIVLAVVIGVTATACRTTKKSELARVHAQKSLELVAWLDWQRLPEDLKAQDEFVDEAICNELVARREVDFLLASLNAATNEDVREHLVAGVLCRLDDRRIQDAFAVRLGDKEDLVSYYVAAYLAKRGDPAALATLNRHYYRYPVSAWQWSFAVATFGEFKYAPAATNLVTSLDEASPSIAAAAAGALRALYPDAPKHFDGPAETRAYYLKRLGGAAQGK
jgi:hypothetical protein